MMDALGMKKSTLNADAMMPEGSGSVQKQNTSNTNKVPDAFRLTPGKTEESPRLA